MFQDRCYERAITALQSCRSLLAVVLLRNLISTGLGGVKLLALVLSCNSIVPALTRFHADTDGRPGIAGVPLTESRGCPFHIFAVAPTIQCDGSLSQEP